MSYSPKKPEPALEPIAPQERAMTPDDRAEIHDLHRRNFSVQQIGAKLRLRYSRIETELERPSPFVLDEHQIAIPKLRGGRR